MLAEVKKITDSNSSARQEVVSGWLSQYSILTPLASVYYFTPKTECKMQRLLIKGRGGGEASNRGAILFDSKPCAREVSLLAAM